jgi:hypothetical protein
MGLGEPHPEEMAIGVSTKSVYDSRSAETSFRNNLRVVWVEAYTATKAHSSPLKLMRIAVLSRSRWTPASNTRKLEGPKHFPVGREQRQHFGVGQKNIFDKLEFGKINAHAL